jgi:hypothetical protein
LDYPVSRNLNSNLKSLELNVPTIPVNNAKYIPNYVSPQADTLRLSINAVTLYGWIDDIDIDNALKLMSRLSTVKNANFSCRTDKTYERKSASYELKMTTLFELLNAFKGDKSISCCANYSDFLFKSCNSMSYNMEQGLEWLCNILGFRFFSTKHIYYD